MANSEKALAATMLGALAVQTIGAAGEETKLPVPRTYAGILLVWFVLGLVAPLGAGAARIAATMGGLVLLVALVNRSEPTLAWLRGAAGLFAERPIGAEAPATDWGGLSAVQSVIAAILGNLQQPPAGGTGGHKPE